MEDLELNVYSFQRNHWVKVESFGPQDMVCWIIDEDPTIWVWESPWGTQENIQNAMESLKRWKSQYALYTFKSFKISPSGWKKKALLRREEFSTLIMVKLRAMYDAQAPMRKPKKNLLLIPSLGANAGLIAIIALLLWNIPLNVFSESNTSRFLSFPTPTYFVWLWSILLAIAIPVLIGFVIQAFIHQQHKQKMKSYLGFLQVLGWGTLIFWYWPTGLYTLMNSDQILIENNQVIGVQAIAFRMILEITFISIIVLLFLSILNMVAFKKKAPKS